MVLVKVNVRGKDVGDKYTFQIILGVIGFIILLIVAGAEVVGNWILDSLFVYTASILLFFTMFYAFVYEKFSLKYIIMMIIGATMLIIYVVLIERPAVETATSVVKALVWTAIFSIYFDQLRKKVCWY
jgi:hypothetical protein